MGPSALTDESTRARVAPRARGSRRHHSGEAGSAMSDSSKPRSTGTEWALVQWFATTGGERVALLNLGGDFAVCKSYSHVAPPAFVQYPSEPEARRAYAAELVRGQRDYVIEYNAAEGE